MEKFSTFIEESFDLKNVKRTKKITPAQARDLLTNRYIESESPNVLEIEEYRKSLKNYKFFNSYTFKDVDEFLILFMRDDGMTEVHLMNMSSGNGSMKTDSLGKSSQIAFATAVGKIVDYLKTHSGPIRIKFEMNRLSLYRKILKSVLQTHLPEYEYKEQSLTSFIIKKTKKHFRESQFK